MIRDELIKKVALKMDEISSSDDVIVAVYSGDNNPLYTQINGLLNESVNDVLTKAPVYRINDFIGVVSKDNITEDTFLNRQIAVITVPNDFIRIVSIDDGAFGRPVVDLALEGDEVDKRQHNKFLMAKNTKPVAVLGRGGTGERLITCYSYRPTDVPNPSVRYIKRFEGDLDVYSDIVIDDYLADIVTWVCAGKVFASQGDITKGKTCDDNAVALMV